MYFIHELSALEILIHLLYPIDAPAVEHRVLSISVVLVLDIQVSHYSVYWSDAVVVAIFEV